MSVVEPSGRGRLLRGARAVFAPAAPSIAPRAGLIGGLIALVAAAMAFLAVAATELGLAADRIAGVWSGELSAFATVRIPDAEAAQMDAAIAAALDILSRTPNVASARLLSAEENQTILAPWLGPEAELGALPLPALIDVALIGGGPDPADVNRQLAAAAPGAVYDDHGAWRAPLDEAAERLRSAAFAGAALTVAALIVMVALATAATLWSAASVVRTLRLIGAEDRFIARAFERPFAIRAALGALVGAAAALLLSGSILPVAGPEAMFTGGADAAPAWPLLALAPVIAGLAALAAARVGAYAVLGRA